MKKKRGRPKNPLKPTELLKTVIPIKDIFEEDEEKIYNDLIDIYLRDFEEDELKYSDIDDVMSLAMNKVIEIRLLKSGKSDADRHLDTANAIEKIRKQSEKFKENLSSRRRDRIDPNRYKGFSIVDLAVAYDENRKLELEERIQKSREGEKEIVDMMGDHTGNRFDMDTSKEDDKE